MKNVKLLRPVLLPNYEEVGVLCIQNKDLTGLYSALLALSIVPSEQSITEVLEGILEGLTEADRECYNHMTASGFSIVQGALTYAGR